MNVSHSRSVDDLSALDTRKFFLRNIPQGIIVRNLYSIFGKFGRVEKAWISGNMNGGVLMKSSEAAEKLRWSLVNGVLKAGIYSISVSDYLERTTSRSQRGGRPATKTARGRSCEPRRDNKECSYGGGCGIKTPRQKNRVQNQVISYRNDGNRFQEVMTPKRGRSCCEPRRSNKAKHGSQVENRESSYWKDVNSVCKQETRREAFRTPKKMLGANSEGIVAKEPQNLRGRRNRERSMKREQSMSTESPRRPPNHAGRRSQRNLLESPAISHHDRLTASGPPNTRRSSSAYPGTPRRQQKQPQNQMATPTSRRSQKKQEMVFDTPPPTNRREHPLETRGKEMNFMLTPMKESGIKEFQKMSQFPIVPPRKPSSSIGTQTRTDMEELEMLFLTPAKLNSTPNKPRTCSKATQVSPSRTARRSPVCAETQTEVDVLSEDENMKKKKEPKNVLAYSTKLKKTGGMRVLTEEQKKARERANATQKKKCWEACQKKLKTAKCYSPVDLPMGQECKVVVVESPWALRRSHGFTFNVVNVSSRTHKNKDYIELQRLMNLHCKLETNVINEVDEIKVGDPLIFYNMNIAFRAVKLDKDEVFLVDIGSTEYFKPGQVFHMQRHFFTLPTLVTECTLVNVSWLVTKADDLYILRNIIYRWCQEEKCLTVTAKGYRSCLNLVELRSPRFDLTTSLMKRGWVKMAPEGEGRAYSREEIRSFQPDPSSTVSQKILEKIRLVDGVQKKK